jgi:hypothetical protein
MAREDHERTLRNIGTQSPAATGQNTGGAQSAQMKGAPAPTTQAQAQTLAMPQPMQTYGPDTYRRGGDYTHGHPGLSPRDYRQPGEQRR